MIRSSVLVVALIMAIARTACAESAPATAVAAAAPPALMLPAGGTEFRQALLSWSAQPVASEVEDLLEMPIAAARLSSRFGVRHDPLGGGVRAHRGIDIPDTAGAPVRAAAGGVIVFAGWSRGYGNLVQIDHGRGNETRYGHLGAITVSTGTVLRQGAIIGLVGSTGRSTGPHLHFEVRENGWAVDPLLRLGEMVAVSPGAPMKPVESRWNGYGDTSVSLPQAQLK